MKVHFSLQKQFVLVAGVYTFVLLAIVLLVLSVSGENRIRAQAELEVSIQLTRLLQDINREIDGTVAELSGLQSRVDYRMSTGQTGFDKVDLMTETMNEFLTGYHRKFAGIVTRHPDSAEFFRLEPIKEFDVIDVRLLSFHPEETVLTDTGIESDSIKCSGPVLGKFGWEIHFHVPLNSLPRDRFTAAVHLDYLLDQSINRMLWPETIRFFLVNRSETILVSKDPAFNNRPIESTGLISPNLSEFDSSIHMTESGSSVTGWLHCKKLPVQLVLQRHFGGELTEWRQENLRLLMLMLGLTVLSLFVIWLFGYRISRSIGDVAQVAREVAEGDFSQKLSVGRNDELGILYVAFNDMTGKLETKIKELSDTRKILSQKQRLALVGEAISKVSHEIQNKIGGVSIWVQNLDRYLHKDANAQIYLTELKEALASFMEMMIHFKRFYREPTLNPQTVELLPFLENTLDRVRSEANARHVQLVLRHEADLKSIGMDAGQMGDALINLLLNAIYYTPDNGRIDIITDRVGNELILTVQDEGPGLQGETDLLFLPFYTTKESGSGLGLAIVNNIILAHGGRIVGRNCDSKGACFTIYLPIHAGQGKEN